MSPSIEQLDRFVRSARAGSYSAAAQELYVSPQTVSKSVHDMEHKLNIVLFEPTGRRLRPTARGAQVLHRASEVLEGVDDIRRICGDGDAEKIHLLMDYTDHPGDVADPWYTRDFEATWRDVSDGCRALLKSLK